MLIDVSIGEENISVKINNSIEQFTTHHSEEGTILRT